MVLGLHAHQHQQPEYRGRCSWTKAIFITPNIKSSFKCLKAAYKNDKPADVHLVCEELKRQDKLEAVGGIAYLTALAQYAGTSAYIEEYVDSSKTNRSCAA